MPWLEVDISVQELVMRRLVSQACLITKHEISAQIAINHGARLYATAGFHTRFLVGGGGEEVCRAH